MAKNHNEINYVHLKAEFNGVALKRTLAANLGAFIRRTMTQIKVEFSFIGLLP
jgi:hypothetical protein